MSFVPVFSFLGHTTLEFFCREKSRWLQKQVFSITLNFLKLADFRESFCWSIMIRLQIKKSPFGRELLHLLKMDYNYLRKYFFSKCQLYENHTKTLFCILNQVDLETRFNPFKHERELIFLLNSFTIRF